MEPHSLPSLHTLETPDARCAPATLGECERSEEESRSQPAKEGARPGPDRKELGGVGGSSRKRKRRRSYSPARSSSSSSSSPTSSLAVVAAKVSRLGRDVGESFRAYAASRRTRPPHTARHDTTTDEDEDDGDDDVDVDEDEDGLADVEDGGSHSKDVDEDDTDEDAKEDDGRISERRVLPATAGAIQLPVERDATGRATPADERQSGRAGSVCAVAYEKNDEKSPPFAGTADLNAPARQQSRHQHQHQHQQHPDGYQQQQHQQQQQQQLRHKRPKYDYTRDQMFEIFQPWVIRTYGDRAKTKTITLKKQARIIKTLRGLEMNNPDSSKFRFWVKTKGFTTSKPGNFQDIFTHQNIPENDGCMLYAPSGGMEPGQPYKKVAVVENFFDIIYGVHVSLGSRASRHAGQKRTYRTITETYAFLPREAVTKFLSLCGQCSKLTTKMNATRSELKLEESSVADRELDELPSRDDSSRLTHGDRVPPVTAGAAATVTTSATAKGSRSSGTERRGDRNYTSLAYYELLKNFYQNVKHNGARKESVPVRSGPDSGVRTSLGVPANREVKSVDDSGVSLPRQGHGAVSEVANGRNGDRASVQAQTMVRRVSEGQPRVGLNNNCSEKDCGGGGGGGVSGSGERNQAKPITSTYLDVTRSFGLQDDDALNVVSLFYYFYGYFSMQKFYNN